MSLFINLMAFTIVFPTTLIVSSCASSDDLFRYRNNTELIAFLEKAATVHKDRVTSFIIGQSVEGRVIKGLKISKTSNSSSDKALLIDAGIHAREWIAPVVLLYTVHQLLENSSYANLSDTVDWYILPMLNPDGYAYSMASNGERLWRKNRANTNIPQCRGIDLNRNFGYFWGGPGSSDDPCNLSYRGPYPFSEPESLAFAEFVMSIKNKLKMYLTLHSAAQAIIYPWGYAEFLPSDWMDLELLGMRAEKAISHVNGTHYIVGPTTYVVGAGAGGSDDWAKGVAEIKYVYTIELPGLHYPHNGFHPPLKDLPTICEEAFQGIRTFAKGIL